MNNFSNYQIVHQDFKQYGFYSIVFFSHFSNEDLPITATSPETRTCPYNGKFEVVNLINAKHSYSNKYSHMPDSVYFDTKFFVHKSTRSLYGGDFDRNGIDSNRRRVKRVDQSFDCDSNGITNLIIGCNSYDTMEFRTDCTSPDLITCKCIFL